MTGDLLDAKEAQALGLINYAVPASELDAKVDEIAGKILANPKWAVRWTKTAANIPLRALAAQLMDASIGWESVSNYLSDRGEAVAAVRERRAPKLTGE
jgi:enoyl-CoA hydratase